MKTILLGMKIIFFCTLIIINIFLCMIIKKLFSKINKKTTSVRDILTRLVVVLKGL